VPVIVAPAPMPAPAPAPPPPAIVYPPAPAPEPIVGTTGVAAPETVPEPKPKSLPHTASPLGLMLLSAFSAFSGAGFVRSLRRRL
jgi:hypothetical protein